MLLFLGTKQISNNPFVTHRSVVLIFIEFVSARQRRRKFTKHSKFAWWYFAKFERINITIECSKSNSIQETCARNVINKIGFVITKCSIKLPWSFKWKRRNVSHFVRITSTNIHRNAQHDKFIALIMGYNILLFCFGKILAEFDVLNFDGFLKMYFRSKFCCI